MQLTSAKTFDNGRMRFNDQGISGERQAVMSDFLPNIEKAGYKITAKIVSLWNNERDPKTLFGDLDKKSELLMRKLWRLLLIEEGEDVDGAADEDEELDPIFEAEAALVAWVARKYASRKATPDVEAIRKRMSIYMQVLFHVQGIPISFTARLNAGVEKIYEGERDKDALLRAMAGGRKKVKSLELGAFVSKVLSLMETCDDADLQAKSKEDTAIEALVWTTPPFEGFWKLHSATFRRIVQLCDKECALKYANERIFPWTGKDQEDMEKERNVVLREFVASWTKGNWDIEEAIKKMWEGVRDYDQLCSGTERHDIGSRYVIFCMLSLTEEFGISQPKDVVSGDGGAVEGGGNAGSLGSSAGGGVARVPPPVQEPHEPRDGMEKLFGTADLMLLSQNGSTVKVCACQI